MAKQRQVFEVERSNHRDLGAHIRYQHFHEYYERRQKMLDNRFIMFWPDGAENIKKTHDSIKEKLGMSRTFVQKISSGKGLHCPTKCEMFAKMWEDSLEFPKSLILITVTDQDTEITLPGVIEVDKFPNNIWSQIHAKTETPIILFGNHPQIFIAIEDSMSQCSYVYVPTSRGLIQIVQ